MKKFDTLQQLWDYCRFCPLCQLPCRSVSVGMDDDAYGLLSHNKEENQLVIEAEFSYKRHGRKVIFTIDCTTNQLKTNVLDPQPSLHTTNKARKAYVGFVVYGDCPQCERSSATSSEIELDITGETLGPIKMDREGIYLTEFEDKFHVSLFYDSETIKVSKCYLDDDNIVVDDNKILELPLVNLDFANKEKIVGKIKTLILFS